MTIEELLYDHKGETVILVDLSWVLYRSHYAFTYLSTTDGTPSGSYYGLTKTIQQLSDTYNSLILLVDDGCPVERKELNESYKGNRDHSVHFTNKKYNVDCLIQPLQNVFRVYNPILEADDLIYSISRIKDFNNDFIIYSSDKDMYQCIDDSVKVSNTFERGELILIDNTSTQYSTNFLDLEPYQVPYYRACLGDASDNLPIIRPRFPSKVAYYFAKNLVYKIDGKVIVSNYPTAKPEDLTDRQYEVLYEIYSNPTFTKNLELMRLTKKDDIPIVDKDKTIENTLDVITYFQLYKYNEWLTQYI